MKQGPRVHWTPERIAELARLRAEGVMIWQIAEAMEIPFRSIKSRLYPSRKKPYEPVTGAGYVPPPIVIPANILADRDQRYAAPYRDQTAEFCGDPPVGFSALDRR